MGNATQKVMIVGALVVVLDVIVVIVVVSVCSCKRKIAAQRKTQLSKPTTLET